MFHINQEAVPWLYWYSVANQHIEKEEGKVGSHRHQGEVGVPESLDKEDNVTCYRSCRCFSG